MTARSTGNADLSAAVARFDRLRVLVAGDFILDSFVDGAVHRISPEAPVPVLHDRGERFALGGAGNVVANIAALGGRARPLGVVGEDGAGRRILALLGSDAGNMLSEAGRITPHKTRFSAQHQQILRVDHEEVRALDAGSRARLVAAFAAALPETDIAVLSDYGKGVLLDGVAAELIDLARAAGCPVVVDPKGPDYRRYAGATAVTPNLRELAEAVGRPVEGDDQIVAAAGRLLDEQGFAEVVVTRGDKGLTVITRGGASHVPATARALFDVSGAGDTVAAALALALAAGLNAERSGVLANAAAGLVVEKPGTAVVTADELAATLVPDASPAPSPVLDRGAALQVVERWRREGLRVGFTNGCFDLLHAGHVSLLQAARNQCDRLVVGLNSDASVRRLKGTGRPVNPEADRALLLAALRSVDLVVGFAEDTPAALIEALRPHVLIKGADYTLDQVVGADFVAEAGGEVVLVELVSGRSTSEIIRRLAASPAGHPQ
ncbi:MAG: D-glycero-beta-D-manno-heptose-7-phosphate kinase [Devosia sp.]|nr:D-glycero-beta-D-manno-heptose-7-phosphate kinase [Devosia sp.]